MTNDPHCVHHDTWAVRQVRLVSKPHAQHWQKHTLQSHQVTAQCYLYHFGSMLSHKLPDILMAKMLVYKVASTFHVPHHQQLLLPLCLEVADTAPGKRIEHIHNCSQGFWHSGEGGGSLSLVGTDVTGFTSHWYESERVSWRHNSRGFSQDLCPGKWHKIGKPQARGR